MTAPRANGDREQGQHPAADRWAGQQGIAVGQRDPQEGERDERGQDGGGAAPAQELVAGEPPPTITDDWLRGSRHDRGVWLPQVPQVHDLGVIGAHPGLL